MSGRRPAPPRYTQLRTATRGDPDRSTGSQTITAEQDDADGDDRGEGSSTGGNVVGVLKLRGAHAEPRQRVTWTDETVDNEFLNRKKSKICCIFHKAKPKNFEDPFAESSSSSSDGSDGSDDDSESDSEAPEGTGEMDENSGTALRRRRRKQKHNHEHGEGCTHASTLRIPPNAYEHQPSYGAKKNKGKGKSKAKASGSATMTITQGQGQEEQDEPGGTVP